MIGYRPWYCIWENRSLSDNNVIWTQRQKNIRKWCWKPMLNRYMQYFAKNSKLLYNVCSKSAFQQAFPVCCWLFKIKMYYWRNGIAQRIGNGIGHQSECEPVSVNQKVAVQSVFLWNKPGVLYLFSSRQMSVLQLILSRHSWSLQRGQRHYENWGHTSNLLLESVPPFQGWSPPVWQRWKVCTGAVSNPANEIPNPWVGYNKFDLV